MDNVHIKMQILDNLNWIQPKPHQKITIVTHRQVRSGGTFIQALAGLPNQDLSKTIWVPLKLLAVSRWCLTDQQALLDLLAKTEEMVGIFFMENDFQVGRGQINSALRFDELPDEAGVGPGGPQGGEGKEASSAFAAAPSEAGDSAESVGWAGIHTPSDTISMCSDSTTTPQAADRTYREPNPQSSSRSPNERVPFGVSCPDNFEGGKQANLPSRNGGQSVRVDDANPTSETRVRVTLTREAQDDVLIIRIPARESLTKEEIAELAQKAACEAFETAGRQVAKLEAEDQVMQMFGTFSKLHARQG